MNNHSDLSATQTVHRKMTWMIICIALLAVLLTGCISIQSIDQPERPTLGGRVITHLQVFSNGTDSQFPWFAVMVPENWSVLNVSYIGDHEGVIDYNGYIVDNVNSSYPPEMGYYWWAGQGQQTTSDGNDSVNATVYLQAGGLFGEFFLDYRVGDSYSAWTDASLDNSVNYNASIALFLDPLYPNLNQDILVTAAILGDFDDQSAVLSYSYNGTNVTNISMENKGNYTGLIPGRSETTTVYFEVIALDSQNQTGSSNLEQTVIDGDPPVFGQPETIPTQPNVFIPVDVAIVITDNVGIADATLFFSFDNVTFQETEALPGSEQNGSDPNTFTGIVPPSGKTGDVFVWFNATDRSGNTNTSPSFSYFADGDLPQITNVTYPSLATVDDTITISVEVIDNLNVSAVYLNFSLGADYQQQQMNSLGENHYTTTVDLERATGNMTFMVSAEDIANNTNTTDAFTIIVLVPEIDVTLSEQNLTTLVGENRSSTLTIRNNGMTNLSVMISTPFLLSFDDQTIVTPFIGIGDYAARHYGLDLLGNDSFGQLSYLFSLGHYQGGVGVGDFDNDGDYDVISGNGEYYYGFMYFIENLGNKSFAEPQPLGYSFLTDVYTFDTATGDYNNDALLDFVVTGNSDDLYLFLGQGNGSFVQILLTDDAPGSSGRGKDAGDLNNDGNLDFIYGEYSNGGIYAYLGDGKGNFTETFLFNSTTSNPSGVALADINNDYHLDVLVLDATTDVLHQYLARGDRMSFTHQNSSLFLYSSTPEIDALDLDDDGDQDLVITGSKTGSSIDYYKNNGKGNFTFNRTLGYTNSSVFGLGMPELRNYRYLSLEPQTEQTIAFSLDTTLPFNGILPLVFSSNDPKNPLLTMVLQVTIQDVVNPSLANITVLPLEPTVDDTIVLSAQAIDEIALDGVLVNYSFGEGFTLAFMDSQSDDYYNLTLDPSRAVGNLSFQIIAEDLGGNQNVSSWMTLPILAPQISNVTPSEVDFGTLDIGDEVTQQFSLMNNGTSVLRATIVLPSWLNFTTGITPQDKFIVVGDENKGHYLSMVSENGSFGPLTRFLTFGDNQRGLGLGDFDLDGDLDVAVGNDDTTWIYLVDNIGNQSFDEPRTVGTPIYLSGATEDFATADFNNDLLLDFVVSGSNDDLYLYLNKDHGDFEQILITNDAPGSFGIGKDAGDLNRDGYQDFVYAGGYEQKIFGYFGDGHGNFTPHPLIDLGSTNTWSYGVVVADIDHDGILDILVQGGLNTSFKLYRGLGDGLSFRFAGTLFDTGQLGGADNLDVDHDGDEDIIVVTDYNREVRYYQNTGNGSFQYVQSIGLTDTNAYGLASPGFLRSNHIVVQPGEEYVFTIAADTSMTRAENTTFLIRSNDPRNPELEIPVSLTVVDDESPLLWNITVLPEVLTVDDQLEITAMSTDNELVQNLTITYWLNDESITDTMQRAGHDLFTYSLPLKRAWTDFSFAITATDRSGNQNISELFVMPVYAPNATLSLEQLDFGLMNIDDNVTQNMTITNLGDSTLLFSLTLPSFLTLNLTAMNRTTDFALTDPFVLVGDSGGTPANHYIGYLHENDSFDPLVGVLKFGSYIYGLGTADFDEDGDLDFVTSSTNYMYFVENQGNKSFGVPRQVGSYLSGFSYATDLAVGDFTNDGHQDFVVTGYNDDLYLFTGYGNGSFMTVLITNDAPGSYGRGKDAGDLNNDGNLDFVYGEDYGNGIYAFLGNGNGSFNQSLLFTLETSPVGIAVADFNGDSFPDILVRKRSDEYHLYTQEQNTLVFTDQGIAFREYSGAGLDDFDVDYDGWPDILVSRGSYDDAVYYRNNGNGTFTKNQTIISTSYYPRSLAMPERRFYALEPSLSLTLPFTIDTSIPLDINGRSVIVASNDPLHWRVDVPLSGMVKDIVYPSLFNITVQPEQPTVDDSILITAQATDDSGI
ncbi:VCBS repeat-containing protein, partial [Candidatus Woesearchaeota archaeon]|nr:VCBS repeat-containing protein [Candidatus Woesearchaeota archaeon]